MKPKVFVASSSEKIEFARAVRQNLARDAEVTIWSEGVFRPSRPTLESLFAALDKSDFGIFIFATDEITKLREEDYSAV